MYIVVIAWLYVVLMMSVAEATNTTGTVLGAIVTFVMYGLLPLSIVIYIMGTPARKRRLQEKAAQEQHEYEQDTEKFASATQALTSESTTGVAIPSEQTEASPSKPAPLG
jgi:hypothetical protein